MSETLSEPVVIWGAGAVGGTVGAFLARAGHEVLFIDADPAHVAAMNRDGLTIEGPIAQFTVPACAALPEELDGPFGTVFLATKAQATEAAAKQIEPRLHDTGFVLSLQNGLNERTIAHVVGARRTVGAFINFGADYLGPGRIHYAGRGAVVIGELDGARSPRIEALKALLADFDEGTFIAEDIWGYLWGKLGYGALLFATALTDESIADCLAMEQHRAGLVALAREMTSAASAKGVVPLGFNGYDPSAFAHGANSELVGRSFDAMVAHNRRSAKTHSGIWRDLAVRKRRTEVDPQLTVPVAEGEAAGVAMPLTKRVIEMIGQVENGERERSLSNLAELSAGMKAP